jgi:hypothetical protein
MTKDEAIHKALKVLNCLNNDRVYKTAWVKSAINACEEALEQPEGKEFFERGKEIARWADKQAQEPVAWIYNGNLHEFDPSDWATEPVIPLYTHPHQWQGLTDDEKDNFIVMAIEIEFGVEAQELVCAIEAKLKEKNHD